MRSYRFGFFLLALGRVVAAAPLSELKQNPEAPLEVDRAIPQSEVAFDSNPTAKNFGKNKWGIQFSTWAPDGLKTNSYGLVDQAYGRNVLPEITIESLLPVTYWGRTTWNIRLGVSYLMMERHGVRPPPYSGEVKQKLHLMGAIFGLEGSLTTLESKTLRPYLQINLRPVLAITTRSIFEQGSTSAGLIFETKLGSEIRLGSFSKNRSQYYLSVAAGAAAMSLLESRPINPIFEGGLRATF